MTEGGARRSAAVCLLALFLPFAAVSFAFPRAAFMVEAAAETAGASETVGAEAASAIEASAETAATSIAETAAETAEAAASRGEAVAEVTTGRILYERNGGRRLPMASTTKVVTALAVIARGGLDETVVIPREAVGVEGSSVYLREGERWTVLDLLYGLLLRSGNDCAVALALHCDGSLDAFAERMNALALACGAEDSRFVNPHGLPAAGHYTTARDLCRIAACALRDETFRSIASCRTHCVPDGGAGARVLHNKNKFLLDYEGADGVKTGYTKEAGRCLVASATRGGMHAVSVVLGCPDMYGHSAALLDAAFARYRMRPLLRAESYVRAVPAGSGGRTCRCACAHSFSYPLAEGEEGLVRVAEELPARLPLPVRAGQPVGNLQIFFENQLIFSQKIVSIESVKKGFLDALREIAENYRGME